MNKNIGFIGCGNMGSAMISGIVKAEIVPSDRIYVCDHHENNFDKVKEYNVNTTTNVIEMVQKVDILILSVKPYVYESVISQIKEDIKKDVIVVCISAGKSIEQVENAFETKVKVVKAMPNTPALVGQGMTGISYEASEFSLEERSEIEQFFTSFGEMVIVPENLMNAVVCASGSSPAYVYMFIEALADSVVKYGIPRKDAYKLVAQTVLGSAKMVIETGEHPGKLKDNVCSPGGTTIKGVAALEEYGLRNSLFKATDACFDACSKKR